MNIFFVSLGCDKNLVDSEYMLGMIRDAGYTIIVTRYKNRDLHWKNPCFYIV